MLHKIGSKVQCIRTVPSYYLRGTWCIQPKLNSVYTVRGYHPDHYGAMWVEEIRNPNNALDGTEMTFAWQRFVPVITTDISVFDKLKNPTPQDVQDFGFREMGKPIFVRETEDA